MTHTAPIPHRRRRGLNLRSKKQQDMLFCFVLLLPAIIM